MEKSMIVKGKALAGPILGIAGSVIFLFAGFIAMGVQGLLEVRLDLLLLTWQDIGFNALTLTLRALLQIFFALLALIGSLLGLIGKRFGAYLLLISSLISIVGSFIPIATIIINFVPFPVTMIYPLFYIESILMFIGGILILVLKTDSDK